MNQSAQTKWEIDAVDRAIIVATQDGLPLVARPFGAFRVLGLIFYQALKLRLKGARYRPYAKPADIEVSK